METTEKIVEAYVRYVKRWATIPNIRCDGQFEIDLLAIDPVTLKRYHIETGVSGSQAFSKLTGEKFDPALLKVRVQAPDAAHARLFCRAQVRIEAGHRQAQAIRLQAWFIYQGGGDVGLEAGGGGRSRRRGNRAVGFSPDHAPHRAFYPRHAQLLHRRHPAHDQPVRASDERR